MSAHGQGGERGSKRSGGDSLVSPELTKCGRGYLQLRRGNWRASRHDVGRGQRGIREGVRGSSGHGRRGSRWPRRGDRAAAVSGGGEILGGGG